jgi:hypothetical protein
VRTSRKRRWQATLDFNDMAIPDKEARMIEFVKKAVS